MAGFLTSVVEEFITGKGTLQQIGLFTPNPALFAFLLAFFGGLTAYATARTIYRATNKEMTAKYALKRAIQSATKHVKDSCTLRWPWPVYIHSGTVAQQHPS